MRVVASVLENGLPDSKNTCRRQLTFVEKLAAVALILLGLRLESHE